MGQIQVCVTKRMLFKSLIFIALAAAALAQTAPEETFVEETFNAAFTHVENFMQEETKARKSVCVKAADASINNVYTEVKTSQKFLNSLPHPHRLGLFFRVPSCRSVPPLLPLWSVAIRQAYGQPPFAPGRRCSGYPS